MSVLPVQSGPVPPADAGRDPVHTCTQAGRRDSIPDMSNPTVPAFNVSTLAKASRPAELWDQAASLAASLGDGDFPTARRDDFLRELGKILAASRKESGNASGWRAGETASLAKACEAAGLPAKSGNANWRSLKAAWAFVSVRA